MRYMINLVELLLKLTLYVWVGSYFKLRYFKNFRRYKFWLNNKYDVLITEFLDYVLI